MSLNQILFGFVFLLATNVFAAAATTLNSYPTDLETVSVSGSTVTLYAGRTGDSAVRSSCTGSGTCNTCALDTNTITGNSVCGFYEVIPTNSFSVSLTITGNTTLTSSAVAKICQDTSCTATPISTTYASPYVSGSQLTVTTTWGAICAAASTSDSSCKGSFDKTFYIGYKESSASTLTDYVTVVVKFRYVVDTNTAFQSFDCAAPVSGEGFCYFTMYPGDKKAYIVPTFNPNNSTGVVADFSGAGGTSDVSGMKYKYLRVLYVQGSGATDYQANNTGKFKQSLSTAVNLNFDPTTGAVSPKKIPNLVNQDPTTGSAYLFTTASVDQAGLVTNYADTSATSTLCDGITYGNASQYKTMDTQCALPQRVSGLLDGQECFIATASYGSIMAPEVETFRKFRGEYLLKSELGKTFVRTYYKYSPPMAEFIAQSDLLRALSRGILFPILIFVKLSLWIGLFPTLILSLILFASMCSLIFRKKVVS